MFKKYYLYAWIILAAAVFGSAATGSMDGLGMVAYSLIALALVYAFALWSVIVNGQAAETESAEYRQGGA